MLISTILLISIFFTYLSKYKNARFFLNLAFILLVVFWGIRYDFGNDYSVYLYNFNLINSDSKGALNFEFGWILLNKLFSGLGFSYLVFFVTIFQFYSIYFYLTHYVKSEYRWLVLLFYAINISLMIHSLSGMRQTIAMSFFVFVLHYVYERKYIPCIIILFLAAQFHSSAYFMLILPIVRYILDLKKIVYIYLLLAIFIVCFVFKDTVMLLTTLSLQFEDVSKYENYLDQSDSSYSGNGLGILLQLIVLIILLINDRHEKTIDNLLLKLYQISFVFVPLYTILPIFNRIQMYFLLLGLGGTPMLIKVAKKNLLFFVVIILYFLMMLLSFKSVLSSGPYSIYQTILD